MTQIFSQPIHYSSQTIRWYYGENSPNNQAKLSQITQWWASLHGKIVQMRSITQTQRDQGGTYWQPIMEDPIQQFEIQNPQIVGEYLIFETSIAERCIRITTECIDFDIAFNQIIAHVNRAIKYVFIAQ